MEPCDILLVIPLSEEFDTLKTCCQVDFKEEHDAVYYFSVKPSNSDYKIYCLVLDQTGPMPAAALTVKAISQCHPRLVVLLGIGGALDKDLMLGDAVIGEEINEFLADAKAKQNQDKYVFNYSHRGWKTPARLTNFFMNFSRIDPVLFGQWQQQVGTYLVNLNLRKSQLKFTHPFPLLTLGHIASGDIVGASVSFAAELLGIDRKFKVIEMEAAGVVEACVQAKKPLDYLIIRGISDFADDRKSQLDRVRDGAFRRLAMTSATTLFLSLLHSIEFHAVFPPPILRKVEIILQGDFFQFNAENRRIAIINLAGILDISPGEITILQVYPGSIILEMEVPELAEQHLIELAKHQDEKLRKLKVCSVKSSQSGFYIIVPKRPEGDTKNEKVPIWRDPQIHKFLGYFGALENGDNRVTILEFYGIRGIGKTELLRQFQNEIIDRGIPCAYVDFNHNRNPKILDYKALPSQPFLDLLAQWNLSPSLPLAKLLIEVDKNKAQELSGSDSLTDAFVNQIKGQKKGNIVVLLCDDTDQLKFEHLAWFEKRLIDPLALCGRCLIVWTGKKQKYWQNFNVACKVHSSQLESIGLEEQYSYLLNAGIPVPILQSWNDRLFKLTGGYPQAIEIVINHMSKISIPVDINLREVETDLAKEINRQVLDESFLAGSSLSIQEWTKLALLREVDPYWIKVVLDDPNSPRSLSDYYKLMYKFVRDQWVIDSQVIQPIKSMLRSYIRTINPIIYQNVSDRVRSECQKMIRTCPAADSRWIDGVIEALYHATQGSKLLQTDYEIFDEFQDYCEDRQTELPDADWCNHNFNQLIEGLENDVDLEEMLGLEDFHQLIEIAARFLG